MRVSVLQLDTDFPRVAGDVGSADSYCAELEVIRVGGAGVDQIVSARPDLIDIAPFEEALARATGDIIVTSCGFLSYWQDHLAAMTDRPFISSALTALDHLAQRYTPAQIAIVTFDETRLNNAHLGRHSAYAQSIVGLPADSHLRDVIGNNRDTLDLHRAGDEMRALMAQVQTPAHRHVLLECTNLPPYRKAITAVTGLPVTDILTQIETMAPGAVSDLFRG